MTDFEAEATNLDTPPERLLELAQLNPSLKLRVANNPATLPDLLTFFAKKQDRCE